MSCTSCESSWAGHSLPPTVGHTASLPTSSLRIARMLSEVAGEKDQVSDFASNHGFSCRGDTKPKGLGPEVKGQIEKLWKVCDCMAYFSSWK